MTDPRAAAGLFIALEGGEGAGKTVQARALAARLQAARVPVTVTREPGGTPLGERLRAIVLDQSGEQRDLDPLSETLLFLAARAELVASVIGPALARGDIVICDRFSDSTRAYQSYGRGVDLARIDRLNAETTGGLEPELVVLLDMPPAQGLARRSAAENHDRFSREELAFHERVREGYHALAARSPERWLIVDASLAAELVTEQVWRRLEPLLAGRAATA